MLYSFKINFFFFCKTLLDPVFPVIAMQKMYLKKKLLNNFLL